MEINYGYENRFLEDYLETLRNFKPFLFQKMYRTGILNSKIGKIFEIEHPEFYLAGFYANIGLQAFTNLLLKEHLNEREREQLSRHPVLASEFLKNRGLEYASNLVYLHHELPDGSGYYKITNIPKEASFINISDTFEGTISIKPYRPALTLREALKVTLEPYSDNLLLSKEEIEIIKKELIKFYNDYSLGI